MDNGIQQYGEAICNKNKQNQKVLEVKIRRRWRVLQRKRKNDADKEKFPFIIIIMISLGYCGFNENARQPFFSIMYFSLLVFVTGPFVKEKHQIEL